MARAGLYRDRVTFQRMAQATDDYGNVTSTFSDHAKRNAHIIERLGKDEIEGDAVVVTASGGNVDRAIFERALAKLED